MDERASRPLPGTLYYRYEKAGLVFEHPPIPWNAEVVIVEANLRFGGGRRSNPIRSKNGPIFARPTLKDQFSLRLGTHAIHPESLRLDDPEVPARLLFRFPTPTQSVLSELRYQDKVLGQLTLPVLPASEFIAKVRLESVGLQARLDQTLVPCQTVVTPQCREVIAQAVVQSPTNLVPLFDVPMEVHLVNAHGAILDQQKVLVGSTQLAGKQAFLNACFKRPRSAGNYWIVWKLADREVGRSRWKLIARREFHRSLRLAGTRFLLQNANRETQLVRSWPSQEMAFVRWAPCFLVASEEAGMAVQVPMTIHRVDPAGAKQIHSEHQVFLCDGPTPVVPALLGTEEIDRIQYFTLEGPKGELGILPLGATPRAKFTSEGGIKEAFDFTWSQSAENELEERLRKLLQGEE